LSAIAPYLLSIFKTPRYFPGFDLDPRFFKSRSK